MLTAPTPTSTIQQQNSTIPKIITLDQIEQITNTPQFATKLIDAIQDGFIAYSQGKFNACPIQTMGAPPMAPFAAGLLNDGDNNNDNSNNNNNNNDNSDSSGERNHEEVGVKDIIPNYAAQTCVKSGYITSSSHYVIKVASGGYPFPSNSGLMQLYSQITGKLEMILLDEGLLTELRTAAVGAVAARFLSPDLNDNDYGDDDGDGDAFYIHDDEDHDHNERSDNTNTSGVGEHSGGVEKHKGEGKQKITKCIGILGSGIQARYQLRYLAHVTSCRNALMYGRTKSNVESFIRDMQGEGWIIQAVDSPNDLLSVYSTATTTGDNDDNDDGRRRRSHYYCPLIVTTTSAREPILKLDATTTTATAAMMKKYGRHITCIGSDSTGKMELDPITLVAKADLLVADSILQTQERGEYEEALKMNLISLEDIVELGEFVTRRELHRKKKAKDEAGDCRLTIFDSSGVAVQDCVVAMMVHEVLQSLNHDEDE